MFANHPYLLAFCVLAMALIVILVCWRSPPDSRDI
jgi:hypothetical protein